MNLLKSYLENRTQIVKVGNSQSDVLKITSGVPQGSILGPLLFIMYINDVALLNPRINIDLYADDSTVYRSGHKLTELQKQLQDDLNYMMNWCKINNMALHHSKTKCMLISSAYRLKNCGNLCLHINDIELENVKVQKLLGVYVDNTLNWSAQIKFICSNLNKKISLLKNIIYFLTPEMRMLFYNAYVLPVFDYCCLVWGIGLQKDISKVLSFQKRIAKIIMNKSKRTHSAELFKELDWLSFPERCKYHSAILIYKMWQNSAPSYMSEIVTFSQNNMYNLRSIENNDIVLNYQYKTKYIKSSFAYYSKDAWNSIPIAIRKSNNITSFKKNVKQFLMGEQNSQCTENK